MHRLKTLEVLFGFLFFFIDTAEKKDFHEEHSTTLASNKGQRFAAFSEIWSLTIYFTITGPHYVDKFSSKQQILGPV